MHIPHQLDPHLREFVGELVSTSYKSLTLDIDP
jgi:hypothetical protein